MSNVPALKEYNGGHRGDYCNYDSSQLERLIIAQEDSNKIMSEIKGILSNLVAQYKDIIRWLLWVVCIIALGSKLVEMANNIWGARVNTFQTQAEEKP